MKKQFLFLAILFLPLFLIGQKKSELGLFLGAANAGTDVSSFGKDGQGLFSAGSFAYGLNYTYFFNERFGLRLNYTGTSFDKDDKDIVDLPVHPIRKYTVSTPLHEIGVFAHFNVLKVKTNEDGSFRKYFMPYALVGGAISLTDPDVDWSASPRPTNAIDEENTKKMNLQLPYGAGVKYYFSEKFNVGIEARSIVPTSDYLDGISESANPDNNDSYFFLGLSLGMRFGMKDRDHDGIADDKDLCPDIPGLAEFNGCPDTDGDGITDAEDGCPLVAGPASLKGCPDTDGDGVADKFDNCPKVAGTIKGCPDTDGDGIIDSMDKCPKVAGTKEFAGCLPPDTDGDGVIDSEDRCPEVAGEVNGCPDTDGDGIIDIDDNCPKVKGIINGCPDTDKDGIRDLDDKCPTVKGIVANHGCPAIKKEVQQKIISIAKAIYFNTGSNVIKSSSKRKLNELVKILNGYPELNMIVEGHTDDRGDDDMNMKLSQRRADAVKAYLVKKGVAEHRLTAMGYGETSPIADNKKAAGRKLNRRVELRSTF